MKRIGEGILGLAAVLVVGCGSSANKMPWFQDEVEIGPGVFVTVEERAASSDDGKPRPSFRALHVRGKSKGAYSETVELRVPLNGSNVHWKGNSSPLNLRTLDGKLYLITYDRVSRGLFDTFFRYFAQQGDRLVEIVPSDYPKSIAGQNMGFLHREFSCGNQRRDLVQIARDIDPSDGCFRTSMTAYIWAHLATGEQYEESLKKWEISRALLEDYMRTNKPIKLTAIVRDVSITNSPSKIGNTNGP